MDKLAMALKMLIFSVVAAMPIVHSTIEEAKGVDEWLHNIRNAKQKVTKFHFYFHDTVSGKNPSAMRVAQSPITDKSPTLFGLVNMIDDPLTERPDPTSKQVGRAQGLYGADGLKDLALLMTLNFVFTTGEYNGSTLSIQGHYPSIKLIREMPIVGGSGAFRLARGLAMAKRYFWNATTGDAIIEYNVWAIHY